MKLKHFEYIKLVKETYKKIVANNEKPLLAQSSPAKIRRECLNVYKEWYDKKDELLIRRDEQTLRAFFGPSEQGRRFLQLIEEFGTDRFKPLDNYLKGITENTEKSNLELLAWLIDFQHRPFDREKDVSLSDEESAWLKEPGVDPGPGPNGPDDTGNGHTVKPAGPSQPAFGARLKTNKWTPVQKRSLIITLTLLLLTGSSYSIWKWMTQQRGCMYWTGDQYVPVDCDEETNGRLFLPADPKKMKNFQRITKEDTITQWSVGKMYYIKNKKEIDYYTYSGNYPNDLNRFVKRLSQYIFDKDSTNRKRRR